LLDDAVAGTVTLATDANVTLSTTNGADNQARNAIILCTGARTAIRTITAPAQSKLYVIINATSGGFGVKIVGAGPTTGITVLAGTQVMVAWNGSDFVVSSGDVVGPASSTDNAITRFDSTTGKLVQNSLVTVADDGAITAPQVGSVIPFYYANQAAFPSAATYHGALAHSHADGAMFFAHSSVWVRLLDAVTAVTPAQGGTGIANNAASTLAISGNFATTLTVTGVTGVTLPTSGSLGFLNIPQSGAAKTTSYTLATTDVGKVIEVGASGAIEVPNSTFATGDAVIIFNNTSGAITMTMTITNAYIAGTDADKATISVATRGVANILFVTGTTCVVTGNVS